MEKRKEDEQNRRNKLDKKVEEKEEVGE